MERLQSVSEPASFTRFGELLHFLRLRARITQRDLSIAVGYSFGQISRLEQGHRLPDPAVVAATFIPALDLEHEPEWAQRLVALAEEARRSQPEPAASGSLVAPPGAIPAGDEAAPLLATKLFAPRARPDSVPRPRLLAQLDAATRVPLTLVVAPAGWGKSTLLASWLASLARPQTADSRPQIAADSIVVDVQRSAVGGLRFGWLSLEPGDNDPVTFVRYLVAALKTLVPGVGAATLALLQAPQLPPAAALLTPLLNDLATLSHDALLVLDDYHLLTSPAIHTLMEFLLEHLPPALHLVLASRSDPPLPLPRLRARGAVVELRAAELRFTPEEAFAFLRDTMGVGVSPDEATMLEAQTEGWVAGLQLAALALQRRADRAGWIAHTAKHHYVADYLAAEVLDRLPIHLRTFLVQTAILERLCGPLCDAVLGLTADGGQQTADRSNPANDNASGGRRSAVGGPPSAIASYSQHLLAELERLNLFLVPLDDARGWYRLHHLFAAVLQERLRSGARESDVQALHARASAWFASHGLIPEAVQHALLAHDWEHAAGLVERHGMLLQVTGHVQQVGGWLEAFPTPILHARPFLAFTYVAGLILQSDYAGADIWLRAIDQRVPHMETTGAAQTLVEATLIARASMRWFLGDVAEAVRLTQQAAALAAETRHSTPSTITLVTRSAVPLFLSGMYKVTGDVSANHAAANEHIAADGIALARTAGNWTTMLHSLTNLAHLQLLQGRLRAAEATLGAIRDVVPETLDLEAFLGGASYALLLGDIHREWNDLDRAERELASGIARGAEQARVEADMLCQGHLAMARVLHARRDPAAALHVLDQFIPLAQARGYAPQLVEQARAAQARIQLAWGDTEAAARWADASLLQPSDAVTFPREALYLTLARIRVVQGQGNEMLPLLNTLLTDAEATSRGQSAIEIHVVRALAFHACGKPALANAALEQALVLGAPEGYVRMFVDEGAPMATLLRAFPTPVELRPYVASLLAAFPPQPHEHKT